MVAHVGTSGWSYDHWVGRFYPAELAPVDRLGWYTDAFSTVELNASFYRWPTNESFARWRKRLPPGFVMSVKAPRGLTHGLRLFTPDRWVDRITRGLHELGDRRGVLLVQLDVRQQRDDARLDYFLSIVPPWLRVAVELRHPSWLDDAVFAILARHGAGYCVMSGAHLPCVLRVTAPFVYVRLHGPDHEHLYAGSYSDQDLGWWRERIVEWEQHGCEVFAYFNNDGDAHAVDNARRLRHTLAG